MNLTFKDKFNNTIRLTQERIKHISHHLDLNNKIHLIASILQYPDIIKEDEESPHKKCYQRYIKNESNYLVVAVQYTNGEGFIITIYKSKKPKK